ncbi:MAG: SpoIIE family protein phosphatase [Candidatus Eisenbacteria bacterium]
MQARPPGNSLPAPGLIAWRRLLAAGGGCLAAWVLNALIGGLAPTSAWLLAILLAGAWWTAIRFLLISSRIRRVWIVLLGIAAAMVVIFGPDPTGFRLAAILSVLFLLFRKYRPYRFLTGPQRARIFLLGLLTLVLISLDWRLPAEDAEGLSWLHGTGVNLARWALFSLRVFWFLSLLQLFFRMRLHFMRLKPKLGVSALFIALVPLILIMGFGVVFTYGLLGGSRATRGKAILDQWIRQTSAGMDLTPIPFSTTLRIHPGEASRLPGDQRPLWLDRFLDLLSPAEETAVTQPIPRAQADGDTTPVPPPLAAAPRTETRGTLDLPGWTPADTTALFHVGDELWLLRLREIGTETPWIDGYRLDVGALDHLSRLLGCNVGAYSPGNVVLAGDSTATERGSGFQFTINEGVDSTGSRIHIRGHLQPEDTTAAAGATVSGTARRAGRSLWSRSLGFGGGLVDILYLPEDRIVEADAFFHLDVRLADLASEFLNREHPFNRAVFTVLAVIAGLLVLLEGLALTLGVRITSGILSAVRSLYQGTVRLAGGDLETRITIPNQDEFGDLAAAFNEMTVAVQRGREAAIAHERLERELETARQIQQHLLPHAIPHAPGFEITGLSVPSLQVGGDYFDFLSYGDGRLGIAIADVSGKGMPAALLMANLQASLQGQVIHPSSVAEVVGRVNTLLSRSTDAQMFATFFYGVLDSTTGTFTSTNAGHNPPIILRAGGALEYLKHGGLLLGMLSSYTYEQETIALEPGDVMVLYTDGVTEAVGPTPAGPSATGEANAPPGPASAPDESQSEEVANMFGEERLIDAIRASGHRSAVEIKEAILKAVNRFVAGVPQSDDITLVVIRRADR